MLSKFVMIIILFSLNGKAVSVEEVSFNSLVRCQYAKKIVSNTQMQFVDKKVYCFKR